MFLLALYKRKLLSKPIRVYIVAIAENISYILSYLNSTIS